MANLVFHDPAKLETLVSELSKMPLVYWECLQTATWQSHLWSILREDFRRIRWHAKNLAVVE